MADRIVFLLDMDAFFASVEERENPELKGKPVVVVGSASPRSVVCAANYAVRKFGVHSAMGYTQAIRLCPHAEVITAHPTLYREVSRHVFTICETFTDQIEIASIDECYMDMTHMVDRFGGASNLARLIKEKIRAEEGVTCTIGIGPNKLLAKLAAGLDKPDGLTEITREGIRDLFSTMPISKLHGIGEKTAARLRSMGLTTAASLGDADRESMRRRFGPSGDRLVDMGQGIDDAPIIPYYLHTPAKSISHEHTLSEDTRDIELLRRTLHYLSEKVAYRLRKAGQSARTATLVVRFNNFQRITRAHTLSDPTDDGLTLYHAAIALLDEALTDSKPVRLIGIAAGNLVNGIVQGGLFTDPRRKQVTNVVDSLNEKFGKKSVVSASLIDAKVRDHITFKG